MGIYYRIQQADRNPADLLDSGNWVSRNWLDESGEDCRYGVSSCASIEDLFVYFGNSGGDPYGCVLVEMSADRAEQRDHDAEHGAVLVWPYEIRSVTPVTGEMIEMIYGKRS